MNYTTVELMSKDFADKHQNLHSFKIISSEDDIAAAFTGDLGCLCLMAGDLNLKDYTFEVAFIYVDKLGEINDFGFKDAAAILNKELYKFFEDADVNIEDQSKISFLEGESSGMYIGASMFTMTFPWKANPFWRCKESL